MSARGMRCLVAALVVWPAALALRPAALGAQEAEVRSRLTARGLPPELVRDVAAAAENAAAQGLPGGAVADKAIEGWAKHVPAARILSAVQLYAGRLADAHAALGLSGLAEPGAAIVVAAAEAMGRGLGAADVATVVRAARAPAAMAPGLTVAAALTGQGLAADRAVSVVVDAMHRGRSVDQLLDIPSMARAMRSEGLDPEEIGKRMLRGEGAGEDRGTRPGAAPGGEVGGGHRPPGMPPGGPGQGERPSGHRPPGEG